MGERARKQYEERERIEQQNGEQKRKRRGFGNLEGNLEGKEQRGGKEQ